MLAVMAGRFALLTSVRQLFDRAGKVRYLEESKSVVSKESYTTCSLMFAPFEVRLAMVILYLRRCLGFPSGELLFPYFGGLRSTFRGARMFYMVCCGCHRLCKGDIWDRG